jgi:hypothetical protein
MSRTEFDRNHGAERACRLLAVRALRCNRRHFKQHQWITLVVTVVPQWVEKILAKIDIKTCLYVYCAPPAPLIRDARRQ